MAVGFELRTAGTTPVLLRGFKKRRNKQERSKNDGEVATLENDLEVEGIVV